MNEHLENLREIRSLMERSSKFISLSGLSGITAGGLACLGAWHTYDLMQTGGLQLSDLLLTASFILVGSLGFGIFFTIRQTRKQGVNFWNESSKNLLFALCVPLVTGGIFCLGLLKIGLINLCFPSTLIFYGLALFHAAKYTYRNVQYVAFVEIGLGLLALFFEHHLLFWTLGFGITHLIYGALMYWKYER